jgi:hypothetical protein
VSRHVALLGIVALLALDWAALDDITTGREPGFLAEWSFLVLSLPVLLVLARFAFRRRG